MASGSASELKHGPPIPIMKTSYLTFKKEVRLWTTITNVATEKQAGTLVFKLPEKARDMALDMSIEELKNGKTETVDGAEKKTTGIESLLEMLDKIYLEDVAKEKFNCYDAFRKLKREKSKPMRDYILEYEKAVKRMKEYGIELPSAVLAYELLRSADVSEYKYSVAIAIVGDLTYENMKDTVRKITELEEPTACERNTSSDNVVKVVKEESDEDAHEESV